VPEQSHVTPEAASSLMQEALALQERNLHEQALGLYARIVAHYPRHPDASHNLGVACMQTGSFDAAEKHLLRALEARPRFDRARSNLIRLWTRMDRAETLAEIVADLRWISALDGIASLELAEHFHRRREPVRVAVAAKRATDVDPSSGRGRHLFGTALMRLGRAEEAEGYLREAVRLVPHELATTIDLARCLLAIHARSKRPDCWLEARTLLEAALRKMPEDCRIHHELGSIREAEGEFDEARAAFARALQAAPIHLPSLSSLAAVSRTSAPQDLLTRLENALSSDNGYSAAENCRGWQALGKCRDAGGEYVRAFACFERANFLAAGDRTYDRTHRERYSRSLVESYSRFAASPGWPYSGTAERPLFVVGMPRSGTTLLEYLLARHPQIEAAGEVNYFIELERTGQALHTSDGEPCEGWEERLHTGHRSRLRAGFDAILDRVSGTARYVIDKMPFNFWQLGMISCLYPGARIIHCRRDRRDVGLSCFMESFSDSHDWSWRLADIDHYQRQYQDVMRGWERLFGHRIHSLDYERLITDRESQLRELLRFLDLEWSDEVLSDERQRRSIRTPSNWQVRQPLYRTSIGRWRNYAEQLAPAFGASP
jgi:tetratricopeptide (TPR) repeat protein